MSKRGVSQLCLDPKEVEAAGGQTVRQLIVIKQGIEIETAKKMVKAIKDAKIKVQAAIQGDELRVSAKNRDDLQSAIAFLRKGEYGLDLQFVNFRD
jgi:cyclic-di-GMP-binding protein